MALDPLIISYVTNEETYQDKAVILNEGDHGDWVYVILEGQAKVQKKTKKGYVTLAILREGSAFGEMAFFSHKSKLRTARVVADGPVVIAGLDPVRLRTEFASLSPQLQELMYTLVARLEMATSNMVKLAVGQKKKT